MEEPYINSVPTQIELKEHDFLNALQCETIRQSGVSLVETPYEGVPIYLGLLPNMQASYFVGASWLDNDHSVVVMPKIENLDFLRMWASALKFNLPSSYLSKFYGIDLDAPQIKIKSDCDLITPLLILQFLQSIKCLLNGKFKRGYVIRQENLSSKVRGRVLVGKQIKTNIANNNLLNVWCEHQEYSKDIIENRILKRAMLFCDSYLKQSHSLSSSVSYAKMVLSQCLHLFEDVGADVSVSQLRSYKSNKLFRHYDEPIKLAKMILRRFGNTIVSSTDETYKVPPFWIDMSRLYEVFVYEKLHNAYGNEICFQVPGYGCTVLDFIKKDERLIVDTKYKPAYLYETDKSAIIHDVRQLAGYARDERILQTLDSDAQESTHELDCVVVYPFSESTESTHDSFDANKTLLEQCASIKGFNHFWKVGVRLPMCSEAD